MQFFCLIIKTGLKSWFLILKKTVGKMLIKQFSKKDLYDKHLSHAKAYQTFDKQKGSHLSKMAIVLVENYLENKFAGYR